MLVAMYLSIAFVQSLSNVSGLSSTIPGSTYYSVRKRPRHDPRCPPLTNWIRTL